MLMALLPPVGEVPLTSEQPFNRPGHSQAGGCFLACLALGLTRNGVQSEKPRESGR